jgi:hypothetical protein
MRPVVFRTHRPGISSAISAQRFPMRCWSEMMSASSSSLHAHRLMLGSRWLYHLSLHCLPRRPGRFWAISDQRFVPRSATSFRTISSSSGVHAPLTRPAVRGRGGSGREELGGGDGGEGGSETPGCGGGGGKGVGDEGQWWTHRAGGPSASGEGTGHRCGWGRTQRWSSSSCGGRVKARDECWAE